MRWPHLVLASAVALIVLSLPACGVPQAIVRLVPRQPQPAQVWQCRDQPQPPTDTADDDGAMGWVADLIDAGQSCRDQLHTAHDIVEGKP